MEHLIANFSGTLRNETLNGKTYLVAPMSLISPGVLNGSKGPLYYPIEEVTRNVDDWNNIPLVAYHPAKQNGLAVSARDPDVLNSQGIGFVFRAKGGDKLTAEGWFDIDAMKRIDNRILDSLEAGKPIELSTGLYTENEPAAEGATFNGKSYDFIARNYKPDHLAILPDQTGACSLQDGCGVLVNKEDSASSPQPVSEQVNLENISMAKKELVTELITNCSCWNEDDREVLVNLSDEKVQGLVDGAKSAAAESIIANAALEGFTDNQGGLHAYDKTTSKWESVQKKEDPAPVVNTTTEKKEPQTEAEWLASAPAGIQSAVQNAMNFENRERAGLIETITSNVEDDAAKKRIAERLQSRKIDELQDLALLANTVQEKPVTMASYFGQAGGTVSNTSLQEEPEEALSLPTIDWSEPA